MRNTKDQLEKTTYENDMNDYETTGKSHRTSKYSKSIYINLVVDDMLIPSETNAIVRGKMTINDGFIGVPQIGGNRGNA